MIRTIVYRYLYIYLPKYLILLIITKKYIPNTFAQSCTLHYLELSMKREGERRARTYPINYRKTQSLAAASSLLKLLAFLFPIPH